MRITSIRGWHWMIIGLIVGAITGEVREAAMNFPDELASLGGKRIGQKDFEHALVTQFRGKPHFTDLVIYPYRLSGASSGAETLHVVVGMYWDGNMHEENGKLAARWEPAYFVASSPYLPIEGPEPSAKSNRSNTRNTRFETVSAYLGSLPAARRVPFRYASYYWMTRPLFLWTAAGFVFIGIVWPVIINLLTFHSLWRTPEPAGESLWNVKPAPTKPAETSEQDLETVRTLDRELEKSLNITTGDQPSPAPTPSPLRTLETDPLEPAIASATATRDFASKQDDFYPTERRGKHEE